MAEMADGLGDYANPLDECPSWCTKAGASSDDCV